MNFELHSEYKPTDDQPQAIEALVKGFKEGEMSKDIKIYTSVMKPIDGTEWFKDTKLRLPAAKIMEKWAKIKYEVAPNVDGYTAELETKTNGTKYKYVFQAQRLGNDNYNNNFGFSRKRLQELLQKKDNTNIRIVVFGLETDDEGEQKNNDIFYREFVPGSANKGEEGKNGERYMISLKGVANKNDNDLPTPKGGTYKWYKEEKAMEE